METSKQMSSRRRPGAAQRAASTPPSRARRSRSRSPTGTTPWAERPAERPGAVPRPVPRTGRAEGETENAAEIRALGQDMAKVFAYLDELHASTTDHADRFDQSRAWERIRMQEVAEKGHGIAGMKAEIAVVKELIDANDSFVKDTIAKNDLLLKASLDAHDTKLAMLETALWNAEHFFTNSNAALKAEFNMIHTQLQDFTKVDAQLTELQGRVDRHTAAASTMPPGIDAAAGASPLSAPVAGPADLAGCGQLQLRGDVRDLGEKVGLLQAQVGSLGDLRCPCLTDACPCAARKGCGDGPVQAAGPAPNPGGSSKPHGDPWWDSAYESPKKGTGGQGGKGPGGDGGGPGAGGDG